MNQSAVAAVIRAAAGALIVSSAAISVPTVAEESNLAIEEVIVTARKKEESVQDVPVAMTALSRELRDSTIRDLSDTEGYSPNVVFNNGAESGGGRNTRMIIRGVAGSAIGEKSFDNPIAVSLDGVFFNSDSGRVTQNFDLERIEVLRGPQGTLFGRNTVGGVINVVRSKPTGELGGKAKITAGRYGQQEVRALLNFPIGDTLSAKVYYTSIKEDGFLKREFDGNRGPEVDYENYGIQLFWEPSDQFDALLTLERYNDHSDNGAPTNWNNAGGLLPAPLDGATLPCLVFGDCVDRVPGSVTDTVETNQPNSARYRNNVAMLTMNYHLNDNLTLVSVTGYHDTPYEDTISELDGSALPFIFIDNDNVYEQFTTELRLEGSYERLDFVVGGYYLDSQYDQDWVTNGSFWEVVFPGGLGTTLATDPGFTAFCATGALDPLWCDPRFAPGGPNFGEALGNNFDQRLYQTQKTESIAMFGQMDFSITEKLVATAGIRWTKDDKTFIGYQAYQGSARPELRYPFNFDVPNIKLSNDWKETTLKLGLAYHATDDAMFFASWSQGFKSGGFYGVNQNIRDFDRNQYDPETADSYEVGMKSQWIDNRLQLNLAAFLNKFKDKQDSNVVRDEDTNTVATVWENQASVTLWGIEAETRFVVTENLDIFATAGYLNAEYDEFFSLGAIPADELTDDSVPIDASGFTPKYAPEWTFGAGGTFTVPVGPGELSLHAKWNFVDTQETDTFNDPESRIPKTHFVNAQIGYEWDRFRITVFGENLTDEEFEAIGCLSVLFCTGAVQQGAAYGVELEVEFGN
jgi:iron complex outermembrane receptor protein